MGIKHSIVKARDLRQGDLIRIGVSTNYILAAEVTEADGHVNVFSYDGDTVQDKTRGPALQFTPGQDVSLSRRRLSPRDVVSR